MQKFLYSALLTVFLLGMSGLFSDELAKGSIIPELTCKEDTSLSYVLYLPSSYDAGTKWPVVYGFDVAGHGKVPVGLLKNAAEKYGYILIGSNQHCKGPWKPIKNTFDILWKDTHNRLSIDLQRVYFTGFDAGARVASRLGAELEKPAAGVLACGAAFAAGQKVNAGLPYIFFATVAEESARVKEMKRVNFALKAIKVSSRLRIHAGKHGWPPEALMTEAIEWFEIQAIQIGIKEEDWNLVDALYNQRLQQARKEEIDGDFFKAYKCYRELVLDFRGLLETNAIAEKTVALRDMRSVTNELARQSEEQKHDSLIREKVNAVILEVKKAVARKDPKKLDQLVSDLHKRASSKEDTEEREAALATLQQFLLFYDPGFSYLLEGDYQQAIIHLELARSAAPTHPEINYNLACAYALNGNKGPALKYLEKAVDCGYEKLEHIEEDEDFDLIRKEPGYKDIIRKLKEKQAEKAEAEKP